MNYPFISISTDKMEESTDFYTQVLGFTFIEEQTYNDVTIRFLQNNEMCIQLEDHGHPVPPAGQGVSISFVADSFEPIYEILRSAGLPQPMTITLPNDVFLLRFPDPNGLPIQFILRSSVRPRKII